MNVKYLVIPLIFILGGCTSVRVHPVESGYKMSHICIEKNERVLVKDFVQVLKSGIRRHGMTSEVYADSVPSYCKHRIEYVATRKWDIVPYLVNADVVLYEGRKEIGSANYHLRGGGGLALNKWRGTSHKISPILDKLFEGVQVGTAVVHTSIEPTAKKEVNTLKGRDQELRALHKLMVDGIITEEDFNHQKEIILNK